MKDEATAVEIEAGDVGSKGTQLSESGDWPQVGSRFHALMDLLPSHLLVAMVFSLGFFAAYLLDVADDGKLLTVIGGLLGMAALYMAVFHPNHYPLLLVSYLPFNQVYPYTQFAGINMTNILVGLGFFAWVMSLINREDRYPIGMFEILLLLYLSLGILNVVTSPLRNPEIEALLRDDGWSTQDTITALKRWLTPPLLFFIARGLIEDREDVRNMLLAMGWCTLLVGILTWAEGMQVAGGSIEESRVGGVLLQANSMGAFLAYYSMLLVAGAVMKLPWMLRGAASAGFLIVARSVLFTFSRGAYLSIGMGATAMLTLRNPFFLLVFVAGVAVFPQVIPESVKARLGHTVSNRDSEIFDDSMTAGLDQSADYRLILWRGGMNIMKAYPLAGVGLDRFAYIVDQYTEITLREGDPRDAHNAFILTGAQLGLPVLLLMVSMLMWLGFASVALYFKRRKLLVDRALALGFLGVVSAVVVSCMLGSRFADEGVIGYFWVLSALVVVTRRMEPEPESLDEEEAA